MFKLKIEKEVLKQISMSPKWDVIARAKSMKSWKGIYRAKISESYLSRLSLYLFSRSLMGLRKWDTTDFIAFHPEKNVPLLRAYEFLWLQYDEKNDVQNQVFYSDLTSSFPPNVYKFIDDSSMRSSVRKSDFTDTTKSLFGELYSGGEFSKSISNYTKQFIDSLMTPSQFQHKLKTTKCCYCEIEYTQEGNPETTQRSMQQRMKDLMYRRAKRNRGWNGLEIERLEPNLEYFDKNVAMCCHWCNNAKTDEFTAEEMRKIGGTMKTIWQDRCKKDFEEDLLKKLDLTQPG
ncbi:MAG: hypothetical protein J0L75_03760 [Spirochaetes bacterium]|nr:hypothetical protein [Spirochaetota bacterium]